MSKILADLRQVRKELNDLKKSPPWDCGCEEPYLDALREATTRLDKVIREHENG